MQNLSPLQEADMRQQFRSMYKKIGYIESIQVLYEIIRSSEILVEVMIEEINSDKNKGK